MSNLTGSFALGSTGTGINITGFGFNPNKLRLRVGAKNGASSVLTLSLGSVDSTGNQNVITEYDDHAGNYTYNTSQSNCIYIRRHNGSAWVDVLKASFNSYITDGFSLNVTAADSNYTVFVDAEN